MDNKDKTLPNYVQVEDKQKPSKQAKEYLVVHLTAPESLDAAYDIVPTIEDAFMRVVTLKQAGHTKIRVFQEVQLKVQLS